MRAPVNKIIPLSTVDGPGLRTSLFFQVCNIHCLYCHNPETQNLCFSCGLCLKTCPKKALSFNSEGKVIYDPSLCVQCDTCIKVCPHHASPKIIEMTPQEAYAEIKKNIPFIRGITVSGGECSLYPDFLTELFTLAHKDNLSCLMDSNGMIDYSLYPNLMNVTDGVMLDIKSWDEDLYTRLVGYSNKMVKKNLLYLSKINKIEELRIVVVPGYVDASSCLKGIFDTIGKDKAKSTRIKLITFRKNGVKGVLENHPSPSKEEMDALEKEARALGFENIERR